MSRKKQQVDSVLLQRGAAPESFIAKLGDLFNKNKKCNYHDGLYWQTSDYNTRLFMMFRAQIIGMALSRFKWVNLPKTCDERFLEYTLLLQGQASIAFPKSQKGVFYSTQLAMIGRPNIYDNPTSWYSIGNNGWRFAANNSSGVVVWDNRVRYPLLEKINIWARELVDITRTKQINRMHQKTPWIFAVPQEMQEQATNLFKQMAGGEPGVIGYPELAKLEPQIFTTGIEFIGKELNEEQQNIWNEIYMMLGIPNQTFKAERQIEDEVRTNKAPSEFVKLDYLNCRREAAKKLNDRFGEYLDAPIQVISAQDNASENYNYLHNVKDVLEGGDNGNSE